MKYEIIFGDERLFDGAPEDAEYAGWFCQETRWYMILNGKILFSDGGTWCTSDNPYLSADIAAMRRIIKEPKRWTWEDKKARLLPEVGAEFQTSIGARKCVITEGGFIFTVNDGAVEVFTIDSAMPVETQSEKAQREEDEFVSEHDESSLGVVCMDLSHRKCYELGKRAAYRKLKGGE